MHELEFNTGVIRPIEVYKEAWALMKDQYWMIFAVTLLGMMIGSVIPIVILGPMICGIYLCMFDAIDGRKVEIERLFKGFEFFGASLIVAIVVMVPVFVLILTIYIPMIGMAVAGPSMSESELIPVLVGTVIFELVFGLGMVCIHTLLLFSFPLIADRRMSGFSAMKLSARAVWRNLGGVAGLFGVGFLVTLAGYMMLCIGLYLVMPLIIMSTAVAYRKIFPRLSQPNFNPPPPTAYPGL